MKQTCLDNCAIIKEPPYKNAMLIKGNKKEKTRAETNQCYPFQCGGFVFLFLFFFLFLYINLNMSR